MNTTNCEQGIISLYLNVLHLEQSRFNVNDRHIKAAIRDMAELYKPNPKWEEETTISNGDYNTPAYRCAYLHKYAMCYTGMVYEILKNAIGSSRLLYTVLDAKRHLNLCSLGGGPGTDIVAVLAVFYEIFGFIQCFVSIIDASREWESVFCSIVSELQSGKYGAIEAMVSAHYFKYEYLSADLLKQVLTRPEIRGNIMIADVLTMIKFISAAACSETRKMVEDIFNCMKCGAILLFIDNAAGGFGKMLKEVAVKCNMQSLYGPLDHLDYENEQFSINRFGYTSQSKTRVAVQIWRKPFRTPYSTSQQLRQEYINQPYTRPKARRIRSRSRSRNRSLFPGDNRGEEIRLDQNENDSGCCSII